MSKPESSESPTTPNAEPTTHKAGRSFTDPERPLGEEVIARANPLGGDEDEGFYGRISDHPRLGHGVAEVARAVSVLRKAEELMASGNPSGETEAGRRRAIELACGRCGVPIHEYDYLVETDEEVRALHITVMDAANRGAITM